MDDGQKTQCGHPDFNFYVKILRVFIDNGRANRQTDRQTDGDIHPLHMGWRNFSPLSDLGRMANLKLIDKQGKSLSS
jgi:hypothetical protein